MKRKRSPYYGDSMPSKPRPPMENRMNGPFDDYEVRDALRTIDQANKIRKNKALMRAVRKAAVEQLQAAQKTAAAL